jgi:hypothetical protein
MPCVLTQNLVLDCKESMGGISQILVIEKANVTAITEAVGVVTAITKGASKKFFSYDLPAETSGLTENINASVQNGTVFYEQVLTFVLNKLAVNTRNELLLLAKNTLLVIVKDVNGTYWLIGKENGCDVTAGSSATGTARGDRSGYSITITGKEKELAPQVQSSIIAGLLT